MAEEQQQQQQQQRRDEPEKKDDDECSSVVLHRTKTIQFFGRSSPIVLQNDNGPCPLLAICNVLLLKNQLNLSPDISEVSQEKLLSLVADRLIDSNSNVNNKDAGYLENQQQNIADAIDLLPRLTTGIDVNIKFRRIGDFEFTPECAIFDLLDIPLYHGWLVDPQDHDTAEAIGSKSYNTLMGELVALETRGIEEGGRNKSEEDCIDFAAATTATLGVPSPCLSRAKSFDDSPPAASDEQKARKGDAEEEAEVLRALKLSEAESSTPGDDSASAVSCGVRETISSNDNINAMKSTPPSSLNVLEGQNDTGSFLLEPSVSSVGHSPSDCDVDVTSRECSNKLDFFSPKGEEKRHLDQPISAQTGEGSLSNDVVQSSVDTWVQDKTTVSLSPLSDASATQEQEVQSLIQVADLKEGLNTQIGPENPSLISLHADSESSSGRRQSIEAVESFTSSVDGSEPLYEGEECILDSGVTVCEDREPVYEGEVILAEQADKGTANVHDTNPRDEITPPQGELIRNFLKNSASQLTFYGLFQLQEGLKERELCVFFRNNHFNTMFKYEGELYLLATDQGYLNQPDLVWEKLNEVNGDTLFMTGNFKEFKLENQTNGTWDEQNAVASTADYLASIDSSGQAGASINSDLQLAIALQQQEFEQQPPRHAPQQPSGTSSSRLITGPQVPRSSGKTSSSSTSPKQDHKSKDKCTIM